MSIAAGVGAGSLAAPSPAAAIPPNGWCYNEWYNFGADHGQVHKPYTTTKHFHNLSGQPTSWSQQIQVNTTFSSTYTVNTMIKGGLDFWIIKSEVERRTQTTTFMSISVNKTSSFTVTVPPHTMMYADYGTYGRSTTGTYYKVQSECDTGDYATEQSGTVQGFSLISEGWRLWEA